MAFSETQGQSVGSREKAGRKFSSTCLKTFVLPFLPTRLTAPGSPRILQGRKDCFSCYSLSLPMNNLFCRLWFCLLTSSGRHLPLFLPLLSNNAVVFRCCCFCARGKLISCPPSLLPPRLHASPVALVVFPMSVFLSVGAGFRI